MVCPWTAAKAKTSLQQLDLSGVRVRAAALRRRPRAHARSLLRGRAELPGFTRSSYAADHALIAPESRVYSPLLGWCVAARAAAVSHAPPTRAVHRRRDTQGAVLVSPQATGAHFSMYIATLGARCSIRAAAACARAAERSAAPGLNASSAAPLPGVERCVLHTHVVCMVVSCALTRLRCRFVFVLEGALDVAAGEAQRALAADDFAYFPSGQAHTCVAALLLSQQARAC